MLKEHKRHGHSTVMMAEKRVLKIPEEVDCFIEVLGYSSTPHKWRAQRSDCMVSRRATYNDSLKEEVHSKSRCVETHWPRDNYQTLETVLQAVEL